MAGAKVVYKPDAFAEIRTSPAALAAVQKLADDIARKANQSLEILDGSNGDGYVATTAEVTGGRRRARAAVITGDFSAIVDEARNHTLERLL